MPTPPWNPEVVVAIELARSLIESQFPRLAGARIEPFACGWDNTAFLVDGRYVFRFPRRQIAVPLMVTETRVLPAIADKLPLPVPVPIFVGRPAQGYPWPFAGYELLPGRELCECDLDDAQLAALARPLAEFMAAMHGIGAGEKGDIQVFETAPKTRKSPFSQSPFSGLPLDTLGRLQMSYRIPRAKDDLSRLAESGLIAPDLARPLRALLDVAPMTYVPRSDTLVHGDLYCRHLLLSDDGRLAGVIDWGDMHLGDPAADLMAAHLVLPPSAHAAFRQAYGPIDDQTWHVARLRAAWHSLYVLGYAADIAHQPLLRETLGALHRLAAGEDRAHADV